MTFDCMTPEEYELWAAQEYQRASVPCVDCPLEFHLAELAAGRCDRVAWAKRGASTTDERRRQWRESQRRRAERVRVSDGRSSGYNERVGRRDATANIINDARVSATTRGAGVVGVSRS